MNANANTVLCLDCNENIDFKTAPKHNCFDGKPIVIDDPWKYNPAKFETNIEITKEDYFKQFQCNFKTGDDNA